MISLTNINCTLDCIYQIDGKCSYDIISNSNLCTNSECAYYSKLPQTKFAVLQKPAQN